MTNASKIASDQNHEIAKIHTEKILIEVARRGDIIAYSDIAKKINYELSLAGIPLRFSEPYNDLANLLGKISAEENDSGRPLLSVLVVNKKEYSPGAGFYNLAAGLGFDVSDKDKFFAEETLRVFDYWKAH